MSNDIEQAMLPKFDPLSTFYTQLYTLQRAEDAFNNAAVALNKIGKIEREGVVTTGWQYCPDDGLYYPVQVRNVDGRVYTEIGDPVSDPYI